MNKRKVTVMGEEKSKRHRALIKLCFAGMFAALVCAATMVIHVPTPFGGYWHFGDCFVLLAGWYLGPWFGGAAAGTGSMFADLFLGSAYYMPGSFVIKAAMAILAAFVAKAFIAKNKRFGLYGHISGGAAAELVMIGGYFAYKAFFLGRGVETALVSVPTNALQGAFGLVAGVIVMRALVNTPVKKVFKAYAG